MPNLGEITPQEMLESYCKFKDRPCLDVENGRFVSAENRPECKMYQNLGDIRQVIHSTGETMTPGVIEPGDIFFGGHWKEVNRFFLANPDNGWCQEASPRKLDGKYFVHPRGVFTIRGSLDLEMKEPPQKPVEV